MRSSLNTSWYVFFDGKFKFSDMAYQDEYWYATTDVDCHPASSVFYECRDHYLWLDRVI